MGRLRGWGGILVLRVMVLALAAARAGRKMLLSEPVTSSTLPVFCSENFDRSIWPVWQSLTTMPS